MIVQRPRLIHALRHGLKHFKAVALLGARQVGKTTLVDLFSRHASISRRFDLERPSDRAALGTPEQTLSALKGLVVIDEVQRIPELFEVLRPLCDRTPLPARFVLLGSAFPNLVRGVSESLAGRCLYLHVPGFSMSEVGPERQSMLWIRGGFPPSFLAADEAASMLWRQTMIETFLERDMPLLGIRVPPVTLRRFWMMLAHYHGQIWNASAIASSMDMGYKAIKHYRDILAGAFMIRILPPWYENLGKRLVKSPKVYLRDSGLLHALLGLVTLDSVRSHAIYGASWEGFALEQILTAMGENEAYFYSTVSGAELDLLLLRGGKRWGFEFKCTDAPTMTKSLRIAIADLKLDKAWVVYPGNSRYFIHDRVEALPLKAIEEIDAEMRWLQAKK